MKHTESLKKTAQFRAVYSHGKSCADKFLVLCVLKNESEKNKLGISVSRKVGNSVKRKRITRLIREVFRLSEELVVPGFDLVFVARGPAAAATFKDIQSSVYSLLKRHRLLRSQVCHPQ